MSISKKYYMLKKKDETLDDAIESTFLSIYDVDLPTNMKDAKDRHDHYNKFSGEADTYKITIKVEKVKRTKK